jgi:hypothetical protein
MGWKIDENARMDWPQYNESRTEGNFFRPAGSDPFWKFTHSNLKLCLFGGACHPWAPFIFLSFLFL